jgi:hypothetical protein
MFKSGFESADEAKVKLVIAEGEIEGRINEGAPEHVKIYVGVRSREINLLVL